MPDEDVTKLVNLTEILLIAIFEQVWMESSGMSPATASCAQTEKSQRIFSLSFWNMDVSPSKDPMGNTFVETRAARSCVMEHLLMCLHSGSTDLVPLGSQKIRPKT